MELVLETTTEQFNPAKATALLRATLGIPLSEASAAIAKIGGL